MINSSKAHPRLSWRLGALSLLTTALIFGTSAAPAAAMASQGWFTSYSTANYVALGDSFTSGQGAPPYLSGPCLQSKYGSYPVITAALSSYKLAANKSCSGASTSAVLAQLGQLPSNLTGPNSPIRLVTLTVGGIDAGSDVILAACQIDQASCEAAIGNAAANLPAVYASLVVTYVAVASVMPNAKVVVLNYPHLFDQTVAPSLENDVNAATDALNVIIAGAAANAAILGKTVQVVDVTQEFANHGIGSRIPYINLDPTNLAAPTNFHPNVLGNSLGYFRALLNDHVLK